jgi:hypothetical protein
VRNGVSHVSGSGLRSDSITTRAATIGTAAITTSAAIDPTTNVQSRADGRALLVRVPVEQRHIHIV